MWNIISIILYSFFPAINANTLLGFLIIHFTYSSTFHTWCAWTFNTSALCNPSPFRLYNCFIFLVKIIFSHYTLFARALPIHLACLYPLLASRYLTQKQKKPYQPIISSKFWFNYRNQDLKWGPEMNYILRNDLIVLS